MVLSSVLLPYLLVAPVVLALHLPGSPPPPRGALADRHGLDSTSVTKRFVSTNLEANLTYVENSGVCETTPGVHQVSGYVTVGKYMHMVRVIFVAVFFLNSPFVHLVVLVLCGQEVSGDGIFYSMVITFFLFVFMGVDVNNDGRRLNGGPGCPSMIGLLQGAVCNDTYLLLPGLPGGEFCRTWPLPCQR